MLRCVFRIDTHVWQPLESNRTEHSPDRGLQEISRIPISMKSLAQMRDLARRYTPAWFQAILVFLLGAFVMGAWVHSAFQGHWWGPFLPGWQFGVPERLEKEYGIFPTSHSGWDGQFYFYQSNDLLASGDTSQHIDNPPYRYQRIGMPLLARCLATVLGYDLVPAAVYHLTQIALVAIGYGFLVHWLRKNGHSSLLALGWLLCDGVTNALAFGMPDPVGDAVFILTAMCVLKNRPMAYAVIATILPLVREGYAVICGLVAIATLAGCLNWGTDKSHGYWGWIKRNWRLVVLTGVPCMVVVGWQVWVSQRFGISASKAGGVMIDYPLVGWWKGVQLSLARRQQLEVGLHAFALLLFATAVLTVWKARKSSPFAYLCLPYLGLLACMSVVAWEDYSGYMKAMGTVIIMMLIFLPARLPLMHIGLIGFLVIEGAYVGYHRKKAAMYLPFTPAAESRVDEAAATSPGQSAGPLSEFRAEVVVVDEELIEKGNADRYRGIWSRFHRSLGPTIRVKVTNTSSVAWENSPRLGMYAVNLSYQWLNPRTRRPVLEVGRTPLQSPVRPGESQELALPLAYPGAGVYLLKISMIQEGVAWFSDRCPQYVREFDFQ